MHHRTVQHLKSNVVAYLALMLAVGGGSGYAIAATASSGKTITACASKKTGELYLHVKGRCPHSERKVTWNQRGLTGAAGATGSVGQTGPAGTSTVAAWGLVSNTGAVSAGQYITAQRNSPGSYTVTVGNPACTQHALAPVVSVSDAEPPNGQTGPGAVPVAWVGDQGQTQFTVNTGLDINGTFTPTDHTFNVLVPC